MSPKVTRWRPLDTVDKGRQACGQRKRRKLLLRWSSTRALSLLSIPPSNPTLETNGGCSARKGDSVPDLELEEFALVRVYDGCSPPEG